jgi:hypothetical protein
MTKTEQTMFRKLIEQDITKTEWDNLLFIFNALNEIFEAYEDLPGYYSETSEKEYDSFIEVLDRNYRAHKKLDGGIDNSPM